MRWHIHWFKKTTLVQAQVGHEIHFAQYYDCRCGETKVENTVEDEDW